MDDDKRTPYELKQDEYIDRLKPLFFPDDPVSNDILLYFSSLLRVLGMEDRGWDPYAESRAMLEDINSLFAIEFPPKYFNDPQATHWRLGLILYSHVVEMDTPLEVVTNLLRFQLGEGYSPNPYFKYLSEKEQKNYAKRGITTGRKIEITKELSEKSHRGVGTIFDEFYDNLLRNSIAHADFILTDEDSRSRRDISGIKAYRLSYEELDRKIMSAKAFISAFLALERAARHHWGEFKRRAMPYDAQLKALMEILVDDDGLMCGFRVHWPNNSQSTYRRTKDGVEMTNCWLSVKHAAVELMVGRYARNPGTFSRLVERDAQPVYTKLEGCSEPPAWPQDAS